MKPPSLRVRVMGYPPVSFGLLAGYAYVVWQWYDDQMPFIMALAAVFAALTTAKAYDKRNEFQDGQRRLLEGGDAGHSQAARMMSLGTGLRSIMALAAIYAAAVYQRQMPEGSIGALAAQGVIWLALLYLAIVFVRLVAWYRRKKKPEPVVVAPPPPPVCDSGFASWMLPVPVYSPTRAEAERELPEYCARLLQRSEPAAPHAVLVHNAPMNGRSARGL